MSWLDDLHANDPAYPAPGADDPWQAPPTADWATWPASQKPRPDRDRPPSGASRQPPTPRARREVAGHDSTA